MIIFTYNTIMSFWERVDSELDYQGISRKFLADKCGFQVSNIAKGIKLGSTPSAETAVKIAQVLGVSVEYLVNGTENTKFPSQKQTEQNQLRLYRKYHDLIEKCEKLDSDKIKLLEQIADNFNFTN